MGLGLPVLDFGSSIATTALVRQVVCYLHTVIRSVQQVLVVAYQSQNVKCLGCDSVFTILHLALLCSVPCTFTRSKLTTALESWGRNVASVRPSMADADDLVAVRLDLKHGFQMPNENSRHGLPSASLYHILALTQHVRSFLSW